MFLLHPAALEQLNLSSAKVKQTMTIPEASTWRLQGWLFSMFHTSVQRATDILKEGVTAASSGGGLFCGSWCRRPEGGSDGASETGDNHNVLMARRFWRLSSCVPNASSVMQRHDAGYVVSIASCVFWTALVRRGKSTVHESRRNTGSLQ